jgi:hypothetical protein
LAGKSAGEMKLAMIGLLIHSIMILWPTGIFAATPWGQKAAFNSQARTDFLKSRMSSLPPPPTMDPASKDSETPGA